MKRGLRAMIPGIIDDVICPNCGILHPRVYNLLSGTRGCGKSTQRMADELGFCNVQCLLEFIEKMNITEQDD